MCNYLIAKPIHVVYLDLPAPTLTIPVEKVKLGYKKNIYRAFEKFIQCLKNQFFKRRRISSTFFCTLPQ